MKPKDLLKKRVRGLAPSWSHNLVRKLYFWWKNCGFGGFSGDVGLVEVWWPVRSQNSQSLFSLS